MAKRGGKSGRRVGGGEPRGRGGAVMPEVGRQLTAAATGHNQALPILPTQCAKCQGLHRHNHLASLGEFWEGRHMR